MNYRLYLLFVLNIGFTIAGFTQESPRSLAGFAIGQWKDIPIKILGKPYLSDTTEIGTPLEAFKHPIGEGWIIAFEYSNETNSKIKSIQLSGMHGDGNAVFLNLHFDMNKNDILKALGKPSDIIDIGEYGQKWIYEQSFFSLDISREGRLWCIKIFEPNYEGLTNQGVPIPSFYQLVSIINTGSNEEIAHLISASLLIKKDNKQFVFSEPWNVELNDDLSGIFKLMKDNFKYVSVQDSINSKKYKQNFLPQTYGPSKYKMLYKQNNNWMEILWAYELNRYRVVAININ